MLILVAARIMGRAAAALGQPRVVGEIAAGILIGRLFAEGGLTAKVVDFSFFPFGPLFQQNTNQIDRVEQHSDAYHLRFADEDVMAAYLLEVTRS